jgi:putative tryptophan/tyrosine transport system substrate-binding protein
MLVRPRSARGQTPPKPIRIGWLSGGFGAQPGAPPLKAFSEGIREGGFVLGQNVVLEVRRPDRGAASEYATLARKLVAQAPAVVLAANPNSVEAMAAATTSIPIVGVDLESDPIARGWVTSLARPGRNVTGYFLDLPEMSGKHLELLQDVRRPLTRVAILGDPRVNEVQFKTMGPIAQRAGVTLHALELTEPSQIARSIAQAARQGAGALLAFTSPMVNLSLKPIADAALEHRLPAICGFVPTFAEAGGLLAYGPDFADLFRRAAAYVVAILKGAAASELPIQRPTKFPLVINLKTAKGLGLAIPPTMLAHADQVIE